MDENSCKVPFRKVSSVGWLDAKQRAAYPRPIWIWLVCWFPSRRWLDKPCLESILLWKLDYILQLYLCSIHTKNLQVANSCVLFMMFMWRSKTSECWRSPRSWLHERSWDQMFSTILAGWNVREGDRAWTSPIYLTDSIKLKLWNASQKMKEINCWNS